MEIFPYKLSKSDLSERIFVTIIVEEKVNANEIYKDVIKLNHYTNLQPLDSYINRNIKRDKLDYYN